MWALRRFGKKKNRKTTTHKINKNKQQKNNNNKNKQKTRQSKGGYMQKKIKTADKVIQHQGDTQMKLKSSNNRKLKTFEQVTHFVPRTQKISKI